ncbi:hypothetical protein CRE_00241 [Caenorhabditis remanei]|uniref:Uncharacterized protein n=1 Tax=Caenorhabditis remanei TaxID=31234 RepID=E3LE04_CAERE|nr:hypothetical protein CRE_00241 [Caenorhabditis remanei]
MNTSDGKTSDIAEEVFTEKWTVERVSRGRLNCNGSDHNQTLREWSESVRHKNDRDQITFFDCALRIEYWNGHENKQERIAGTASQEESDTSSRPGGRLVASFL